MDIGKKSKLQEEEPFSSNNDMFRCIFPTSIEYRITFSPNAPKGEMKIGADWQKTSTNLVAVCCTSHLAQKTSVTVIGSDASERATATRKVPTAGTPPHAFAYLIDFEAGNQL